MKANSKKMIIIKNGKESFLQVVKKLMMLSMNVSDGSKAEAFYADKIGLQEVFSYGR